MSENLDDRTRSQKLHQESQKEYDKAQNALCFVVLGAIFLAIGIIFIFLANKRENNQMVGVDTGSIAFYICLLGLIVGGGFLIYGGIKFFIAFKNRRVILREINTLKK
ncbi:MAG: hypothetical protein WCS80_00640 [Bacilli bacterium]